MAIARGLKSFTLRMIGGANIATVIVMLLVGYSFRVSPEHHSLIAGAGLFFPVFLVLNFGFLVFWLFFHWRGALIPILGYVAAYFPVRAYIPFNYPSEPPEGSIKVVSYNVFNFAAPDAGYGRDNQIIDYLCNSGADIICLQEASAKGIGEAEADSVMKTVYPYSDVSTRQGDHDCLRLYSKFPVLSKERVDYESDTNLSMAYVLDIHGDSVLVVNNHFESNKLNPADKAGFRDMVKGHMDNGLMRAESKLLFGKLAAAARIRAPQVQAVAEYVDRARREKGMSAIVCGDFNDTPVSYAYYTLSRRLTDCYAASGNGPGFSYHRSGMYVRIDHIFCTEEWRPYAAETDGKIAVSDHYPVMCWLKKQYKP